MSLLEKSFNIEAFKGVVAGGRFAFEARLDGPYFYCRQDQMVRAAHLLADVADLSMQARPACPAVA